MHRAKIIGTKTIYNPGGQQSRTVRPHHRSDEWASVSWCYHCNESVCVGHVVSIYAEPDDDRYVSGGERFAGRTSGY